MARRKCYQVCWTDPTCPIKDHRNMIICFTEEEAKEEVEKLEKGGKTNIKLYETECCSL